MASILLIGSEQDRICDVRGLLRQDGHQVHLEPRTERWRESERRTGAELVVASLETTDAVISAPTSSAVKGFPPPILFVQQESDFCRDIHLDERLVDHIATPFMEQDLLGRVDALVRVRRVIRRDPLLTSARPAGEEGAGEETSDGVAAGPLRGLARRLTSVLRSRIPPYERPLAPYLEVAAQVADWADRRDAFEPGHAERVTSLCAMIGEALSIGEDETAALMRAAMLHDIGKIALPVEVLRQRTPLEETQMRLIRTHPRRGAALLQALDQDDDVADTILYHHERPDGSGYYGKPAESVPRTARILAVAEVYDAMTSSRIKQPMPSVSALRTLEDRRGEAYDADCVGALVDKLRPRPRVLPLSAPSPRG